MVSFVMIQVKQYKYQVFCLDPFHYLSRCLISKLSFKDIATHKVNFCYNFNFDLSCIEVKYYTLGDTKTNAPPV